MFYSAENFKSYNHFFEEIALSIKELIPQTDMTLIYMYNKSTNSLDFAYGTGVNHEEMRNISFIPGESITGKTYLYQEATIYASQFKIELAMNNMSAKNYDFYLKGTAGNPVKNSICVPIIKNKQCLGIVLINSYKEKALPDERDLKIAKWIITKNLDLLTQKSINYELEIQTQNVIEEKTFYETLMIMYFENRDITTILKCLEEQINCQCNLELEQNRKKNIIYLPIINNHNLVAYLTIHCSMKALTEKDHNYITQTITFLKANLHYLLVEWEKKHERLKMLFYEIINGKFTEENKLYFKEYSNKNFICAVLEYPHFQHLDNMQALYIENILSTASISFQLILKNDFFIVLFDTFNEKNNISSILQNIFESHNNKLLIGIGSTEKFNSIGASYNKALNALNVLRKRKNSESSILYYEELGIEKFFSFTPLNEMQEFAMAKLGPLLDIDPVYMKTLEYLIHYHKNKKLVAEKLFVHINTLYFRIKKIESAINTSIDDENSWAEIIIAYQIYTKYL